MSDLDEFHHELIADIQGDADVLGLVTVEAFFEKVGELLTEAGELDGANRAYFEGGGASNPMRIDGYGGIPETPMVCSALCYAISLLVTMFVCKTRIKSSDYCSVCTGLLFLV